MRVTISTDRERAAAVLRSWPCACIAAILSGQRPDDRIRATARPLDIIALAIVGFWLVAHLLWMGPVETAAETTAMFALGVLSGAVGVAAIVLLAVALAVGGMQPALPKFARGARNAATVLALLDQNAPCRPAPDEKRAAPSRLSPASMVALPSSNSRRSAASSVASPLA
jgi:hypothetical protein